jgi:transposase
MQKAQQWEIAGEAAWGVALHREAVIRPLAEQPRLSAESIAEAANQLGLSRSILYKLLQRYRRRPQTSSLLPWKRGRKPDEPLLSDEREALLNARCRAALKSRIGTLMISMPVRDLTTLRLHSNRGLVYLNRGQNSGRTSSVI